MRTRRVSARYFRRKSRCLPGGACAWRGRHKAAPRLCDSGQRGFGARRAAGQSIKCFRRPARTSGTMKAAQAATVQRTLNHWMLSLPCLNSATGEAATARSGAGVERGRSDGNATPRSTTRPDSAAGAETPTRARTAARGAAAARDAAARGRDTQSVRPAREATGAAIAAGARLRDDWSRTGASTRQSCGRRPR